ncbi:MAG: hypothetical protein HZC25_08550 [Rhodospirillales bacterium]|nr:hypothetical protein [Rhodospirillales bacterium]
MNHWSIPNIPHKGWTCIDVIDVRGDGQSTDETDYETCEMCGNEKIRYVHVMEHPDLETNFRVGCICAEKMSDDYVNPRRLESKLRNRAARRARWTSRSWKVSRQGNKYLNLEGFNLVIFQRGSGWGFKIEPIRGRAEFSSSVYRSEQEAMRALFDQFWKKTSDSNLIWNLEN